ncbi:putative exported protein [Vibrio maritimus]|uniref:Putative exported protein n=1 Tax=Vibrio maritimus TaxID=990268 RepID=A0A090S663_9VIBR|nr:putative exported protein [Vibrio maritimus]
MYDVENGYRKVEEFSGFGIGPHEIITMSDGRLVVGVGGVHTQGRSPLNLDTMNQVLAIFQNPVSCLIKCRCKINIKASAT